MPIAGGMAHIVPSHVLRVGQTIRLDPAPGTLEQTTGPMKTSDDLADPDLDMSLEKLNQLILDLDPTFKPIEVKKSPASPHLPSDDWSPDDDVSNCLLVSRGCSASVIPSPSCSIPIPSYSSSSCSPHGSLVFSGSPSSSRPPLPCGYVHRRRSSQRNDISTSQGSLRMPHSNRNSTASLLSLSPGSDTSYILGSSLSLASEDADSAEPMFFRASGSFNDVSKLPRSFDTQQNTDKHWPTRPTPLESFHGLHSKGTQSSPASLSGSLTDIPVVLVNGTPEPTLPHEAPAEIPLTQTTHMINARPSSPHSSQNHFQGSQHTMKFVMDTSKFWFRPHINRTEAEALVKDKEPGAFVVRDSTSYKGSFGLAMKVDQVPANISPTTKTGESSSELVRHFLIESSAKGVRIKGSSQEPYFGSLSALVYQHTITAYALPCKLLLQSQDLESGEEEANSPTSSGENTKTACNFLYLNAVPIEMLTGPCAVQKAVSTLLKAPGSLTPTTVNLKVSPRGITLTDIKRKLFFRRHYPAHLLSYSGEDPDKRQWLKDSTPGARMFGIVAKGKEAGIENVCHIFAEYDPLQSSSQVIEVIERVIDKQ